VTIYLIMLLFDKKTKTYLKDVYSEANFTFTIDNASEQTKPEELVTDSMIQTRLNDFFEKQEALPRLKTQYQTLPDFYIGSGKMFNQQVFFEEVTDKNT
jgi:hypothetical protein